MNPNVADLCRGKTRQNAPDVVAHSLGQIEAYFTVREILAEASTAADGVFGREHRDFGRCRFATLGLHPTFTTDVGRTKLSFQSEFREIFMQFVDIGHSPLQFVGQVPDVKHRP